MRRERLKYVYNLAVAAALAIGFAAGYSLKGRSLRPLSWGMRPARSYDKDFPGARARYNEIKRDFSRGRFVKTDFGSTVEALRGAIKEEPGYLPYYTLLAKVHEDAYENLRRGRLSGEQVHALAESLGLDTRLESTQLAEECKEKALSQWQKISEQPMFSRGDRIGAQWQAICQQHINALGRERHLRVTADTGGMVDLTPAYNVYAITRDHDRYVNNVSSFEKGPTFEEKHIPDIIRCPNHPEVAFQFPCLAYLSVEKTRTVREDVDFFCNAMAQDGQHLDLNDIRAEKIHLLCFNVTEERRIVDSVVRVEFGDGSMENYRVAVGPWMQSQELLRNVARRSALDAAFRDTEVHLCNGLELETMTSPIYIYHVVVDMGRRKIIDKIVFPRHDSTTVGLEDEGIRDVRIVAVTVR
jgi:hypothetical protein